MNKLIGLVLVSIFSLTGCGADEDVNSKTFYMENEKARIAKLEYCNDRTDKKVIDQNCVNASSANTQLKTDLIKGDGIAIDYSKLEKKSTK